VDIVDAPGWAEPSGVAHGTTPNPSAFGDFARAAASRYGGSFAGLPRVRYWQAWNEPNLNLYLKPQWVDRIPFSPGF
jgi:hypothetical protein